MFAGEVNGVCLRSNVLYHLKLIFLLSSMRYTTFYTGIFSSKSWPLMQTLRAWNVSPATCWGQLIGTLSWAIKVKKQRTGHLLVVTRNYANFVEKIRFRSFNQKKLSNPVYNKDKAEHFRKATEWSVCNGYGVMVSSWHFQLFLTGGNEMPGCAGKILVFERESALGWRWGQSLYSFIAGPKMWVRYVGIILTN